MTLHQMVRSFEIKAVADSGEFEGYGAVFGNVDLGRDIIAPGAFSESLAGWKSKGRMPKLLWQHDMREPIGVWTAMDEDTHGLHVKGKFTRGVRRADEAYALMKDNALDGLSIGYRCLEDDYDRDLNVRKLKKVDLFEVSVVTLPMNPAATVTNVKASDIDAIKSLSEAEEFLREAGPFSRKTATDFISVVKRIAQREAGAGSKSLGGLLEQMRSVRTLTTPT